MLPGDPLTTFLIKVAAATGVSTYTLALGLDLIGQSGAPQGSTNGWVLTGGGLAGILVLIWKLVSDHTTVTRERKASDEQIQRARSDAAAAEAWSAKATATARLMEAIAEEIWLEAARAGVLLDSPAQRREHLDAAAGIDPPTHR